MIYFSGCLHLYHSNIIKYCHRPFSSVEEMREDCLNTIRKIIKPEDTWINLGDLWCQNEEQVRDIYNSIKCKEKIFIIGNHDKITLKAQNKYNVFHKTQDYLELKYKDNFFCCSHYPYLSWNHQNHGAMMIHSHTHAAVDKFNTNCRRMDVGYDSTKQWLISIDEVVTKLQIQPVPSSNTTGS